MITAKFNNPIYGETPLSMISGFRTEGECRCFLEELEAEYKDPKSTMPINEYVRLHRAIQVKLALLRLHGPA